MKMLMGKKLLIVVIFLGNRVLLCLLRVSVVSNYRVFFYTGPPPKSSKYKNVNLGKDRCI